MTYASGYDVIVSGSGSQSLIVSALLASRGANILVLSTLNKKRFGRDGYQFPDENPLFIDFCPDGILGKIFADIDLPFSYLKGEEQLFRDLSPSFQVVLPDYRIDIFQDEAELLDELCRELRGEKDHIISLFNEANRINSLINNDEGTSILYKLKGLIKRINLLGKKGPYLLKHRNPPTRLLRFFDMLSIAFFGIEVEEIDVLRLLSILRMLKGGGRSIIGGIEILNDLLIKRIRSNGGEFYDGDIERFMMKGRRITGIKTAGGDLFDCKIMVMERQARKWRDTTGNSKSFSLYFGIEKDFVPSAMGDYLILVKDYSRRAEGDNLLMLSLIPLSDPRWAPKDKRGIIATTLIPPSQKLSSSYAEGLRNHILDRLIWLMPFSGGHIEFIGDDLIFERAKEKEGDPLSSLSSIPKNLYPIDNEKDAWIRTSEDLAASYKIASLISEKI